MGTQILDTAFLVASDVGLSNFGTDNHFLTVPAILGRRKSFFKSVGLGEKDLYVGEEAQSRRGVLNLISPIQNGYIKDFFDMEEIWRWIFESLQVEASETTVMMSETCSNIHTPQSARMVQIMFETFNTPHFSLKNDCLLSLLEGSSKPTGIVLSSGAGLTYTVPIHNYQILKEGVFQQYHGGDEMTSFLQRLLSIKGVESGITKSVMNDIKHRTCFILEEYGFSDTNVRWIGNELDRKNAEQVLNDTTLKELPKDVINIILNFLHTSVPIEKQYELPDGEVITVDTERYTVPESIFHPSLMGLSAYGIHDVLYKSIRRSPEDIRSQLFGNILLSGGSTLFEGFKTRLSKELRNLAGRNVDVNVIERADRQFLAWTGASLYCSLDDFLPKYCMSKEQYEEEGPDILLQRFPTTSLFNGDQTSL